MDDFRFKIKKILGLLTEDNNGTNVAQENNKPSKVCKNNICNTIYEPDSEENKKKTIGSKETIGFDNEWNENELEKELNDNDIIFDDDDNDDVEEDDEKTVLRRFEQQQKDIFEGVPIDDPVRMYLKEIGQYELLTAEQEKKLAKEKQDAQDLLKKKKFEKTLKMTEEEAIKLPVKDARLIKLSPEDIKIVRKGEMAQEVLIHRNLRLVVSIAKGYIGHGVSLLDLIQEGNLGLMRSVEKYSYRFGYDLKTYLTWGIRQYVCRALVNQSKTIRIPVHMVETINRLNKVKKKLATKLGGEPTAKQIAKEMKMPVEKVEEIMQIALDPISLDKPVGDEDDSIVADFIVDQNVISPEKYAEMVMLKEQIRGLLSTLKDRERKVLVLRFGIEDDRPRTLEEVGKELRVTRERIRQIEDKALSKLRFKAKKLISGVSGYSPINDDLPQKEKTRERINGHITKGQKEVFESNAQKLINVLSDKSNIKVEYFKKSERILIKHNGMLFFNVHNRNNKIEILVASITGIEEKIEKIKEEYNIDAIISHSKNSKQNCVVNIGCNDMVKFILALTFRVMEMQVLGAL